MKTIRNTIRTVVLAMLPKEKYPYTEDGKAYTLHCYMLFGKVVLVRKKEVKVQTYTTTTGKVYEISLN